MNYRCTTRRWRILAFRPSTGWLLLFQSLSPFSTNFLTKVALIDRRIVNVVGLTLQLRQAGSHGSLRNNRSTRLDWPAFPRRNPITRAQHVKTLAVLIKDPSLFISRPAIIRNVPLYWVAFTTFSTGKLPSAALAFHHLSYSKLCLDEIEFLKLFLQFQTCGRVEMPWLPKSRTRWRLRINPDA